jgi:hypothetical protein
MKALSLIISLASLTLSGAAFAYGTGVSSFPLQPERGVISAEFTGITSTGGGMGLQTRYSHKIQDKLVLDAGIGMGGGERTNRLFAGADYELFPDYQNQPRISTKFFFENAEEFNTRRNALGFAPTISKGFAFWGEEAYPFFALPVAVNLDSKTNTYATTFNANLGITGHLPIEGYRHLMGTLEATLDIKDSYTGFFMGVSYPIN